jgi:phage baseplate assembly protein gpV
MSVDYEFGPTYGVVSDNNDPDNLGRIKVALQMWGENIVTNWIPVLNFYNGAYFLPDVGDQVAVAFMDDSSEHGVVLGGIWSNVQRPPETEENTASDLNQDGENNLKFIKSRAGHKIILDDKSGDEKVQIIVGGGTTRIDFKAAEELLNIETDVDLQLSATKKIEIEAEEGDFQFTQSLKISAEEMLLESTSADLKTKAGNNLALEGQTINLN